MTFWFYNEQSISKLYSELKKNVERSSSRLSKDAIAEFLTKTERIEFKIHSSGYSSLYIAFVNMSIGTYVYSCNVLEQVVVRLSFVFAQQVKSSFFQFPHQLT